MHLKCYQRQDRLTSDAMINCSNFLCRMLKCDDRHVKMDNKLYINNPYECFCVSVECKANDIMKA